MTWFLLQARRFGIHIQHLAIVESAIWIGLLMVCDINRNVSFEISFAER